MKKIVTKFQMDCKLCRDNMSCGTVGSGWWYVFLRRNGQRIVTQQGEKFAIDRLDWTTLHNISQMYDIMYDEMVDTGVAEKLDTSMFMNQKGEIVEKFNGFGRKVDTKLTHPEYCLFADKTRCNTLMKKDVHVAGTKYITAQGTQAQRMASTSNTIPPCRWAQYSL